MHKVRSVVHEIRKLRHQIRCIIHLTRRAVHLTAGARRPTVKAVFLISFRVHLTSKPFPAAFKAVLAA
jgi:hypothetical protein